MWPRQTAGEDGTGLVRDACTRPCNAQQHTEKASSQEDMSPDDLSGSGNWIRQTGPGGRSHADFDPGPMHLGVRPEHLLACPPAPQSGADGPGS